MITNDASGALFASLENPPGTPLQKLWLFFACGFDSSLEASFYYLMHGMHRRGVERFPPSIPVPQAVSPAGYKILVDKFNGYLKELRYFSDCLDSSYA